MKVTSNPNPSTEPRGALATHGPLADALLDEVRGAAATLTTLLAHGAELGEPVTLALRGAIDEVSERLNRRELRVAVVGEERSGKSTFLDALLGERLLGMAKTPPNTVTTIRSTPDMSYRAKLTDGFIDDFAVRVPLRAPQLTASIETNEARLSGAKRRSVAAAVEVAAAADALERVQTTMTDAFRSFEKARTDAARCSARLATTQEAWGRLSADATDRAAVLPALVRRPPPHRWAFWLWVVRFVALLLHWNRWRSYRASVRASGKAEAEVDALRAESSRAAERCCEAEAKLAASSGPVEEARRALDASQRVQREAETACATIERAMAEDRQNLERERVERKRHFIADVRSLSNMEDRGQDVVELEIDYPAWLLPDDVILIETPGVTTDDAAANERAWRAIRERADTCILVSELERAVSGETHKFLHPLREAVPHAVLVLTKTDETVRQATRQANGDPAEQVDRARRISTRRFAREMGLEPTTVLSVAVAAEETLRGAPTSEPERKRFETDVATLFTLLRYERALILGASSAGIVRRCIGSLAEAQERAALAHRDRIASLESHRIPHPDQFHAEQMASVERAIDARAKEAVAAALIRVHGDVELLRATCKTKIGACGSKRELGGLASKLTEIATQGLAVVGGAVRAALVREADRATQEIENSIFQALRERYYILHQITRSTDEPVVVDAAFALPAAPADLALELEGLERSFDHFRVGFGVGGAAIGAGIGTLVFPGIGSVAGALVGGLATFAKTLGALKKDFAAAVDASAAEWERALGASLETAVPAVATAMRTSLGKSLERAMARFARFVDEPLEEQRLAIEGENQKLHELEQLHTKLQEHDARLASLIKMATDASVGLCR